MAGLDMSSPPCRTCVFFFSMPTLTTQNDPTPCSHRMSCVRDVRIVTAEHKDFQTRLAALFDRSTFNDQCMGVKGGVNLTYARGHMKQRATVIAYVPREPCARRTCTCGFGLGFAKTVPGIEGTVFYIDLVCSQERMGGRILAALEAHGARQGARVAALRAAVPALVRVYLKKGDHRLADACDPPSRAGRLALRELDRFSRSSPGSQRGPLVTDGTRVVSSPVDAWRASKQARPKRAAPDELPDG